MHTVISKTFPLSLLAISLLIACSPKTEKTSVSPRQTTNVGSSSSPSVAATNPLTDEQKGRKIYARCRSCHTLKEGEKHKVGPNLWKIFGRKAGDAKGFAYSKAMISSNIIWTEETLDSYINNPATYIPSNRMMFAGLRKPEQRKLLISYLKTQTGPQIPAK